MAKLLVDGVEVTVPDDFTVLQAAEAAGAEIPRFCYHERLSIAGNCRMCLVEVKGVPKPVASCAYGVRDCRPGPNGEPPQIVTKSPMVKKARHGVMEFLLINHPLDCPICDQGGECDLQDQAMAFGVDASRFAENKRAVEDKYIGALVKTSMNRCIHCTRCVRFSTEVAGVAELGAIGRGEDLEITTYLEAALSSELQGNLVDLCPVGALTSKPYAFQARPWELVKTNTVDVMDALGASIRVDVRGREVVRILPRTNDAVNEEWISDKTRHVVDGLKVQRLDRPYIREGGRLRPASWPEAFGAIAARVKTSAARKIGALAGQLASVEEIFALKILMQNLGSANIDCRYPGSPLSPKYGRAGYLFNSTVAGIETSDAIMLIGTNPRRESPVLNARIRKRYLKGGLTLGLIGEKADLTYPYAHIGTSPKALEAFLAHKPVEAKNPMFIIGQGALNRTDGAAVLALAARAALSLGVVTDAWNGFNILHTEAALVGALDVGFVPGEGGLDTAAMLQEGALDVVFLLGVDEIAIPPGAFAVYIGSHGDRGAHRADVILPGAAYTEKSGTYINTEGRVQFAERANFPPGDAREDWAVLRALSAQLGATLPFDSLASLRRTLISAFPHLGAYDAIGRDSVNPVAAITALAALSATVSDAPFASAVKNFYFTNAIARASATMAECSALQERALLMAAE